MPTKKQVKISIATADLETLKNEGYNLCIAKMVDETFNVVWQSSNPKQYLQNNTFSWTPTYQLFGANSFEDGLVVEETTEPVNIGLGQQSVLNKNGILQPPSTGGPSTAITMINNYGSIHPGLNLLLNTSTTPTPIYLAPAESIKGTVSLTPVDKVLVWFEQKIVTGTVFSDARSNSIELDLTAVNTMQARYQDQEWKIVASDAREDVLEAGGSLLSIVLSVTGAITAALLATKIGTRLTGVYQNIEVRVKPESGSFEVVYQEKHGADSKAAAFFRSVAASGVLRDRLVEFTVEALADLAVDVKTLTVQS
jgi:hypothetical protein